MEQAQAQAQRGFAPYCLFCGKKLLGQYWHKTNIIKKYLSGFGYKGKGHFCSKTCAAEWAEQHCSGDYMNDGGEE